MKLSSILKATLFIFCLLSGCKDKDYRELHQRTDGVENRINGEAPLTYDEMYPIIIEAKGRQIEGIILRDKFHDKPIKRICNIDMSKVKKSLTTQDIRNIVASKLNKAEAEEIINRALMNIAHPLIKYGD